MPLVPCRRMAAVAELSEIGREQWSSRYHDTLRDIAHNARRNKIATCTANCVKLVDMSTWKETHSELIDKEAGPIEELQWSPDGSILSVSTRHGFFYNFALLSSDADAIGALAGATSALLTGARGGSAVTVRRRLTAEHIPPAVCCGYLVLFCALLVIGVLRYVNAPLSVVFEVLTTRM